MVIGARNLEKADEAVADILDTVPEGSVEVVPLDLGSLASIDSFAAQVMEAYPEIDLLFNNAGVMATPEWTTEDGFEAQFGINHLGHFYLTPRPPAGFGTGRRGTDREHNLDRAFHCWRLRPGQSTSQGQLRRMGGLTAIQSWQMSTSPSSSTVG